MKQKYQIIKDTTSKQLLIKEYAVLDSNPRRKDLPTTLEEDYALLSEQSYDNKAVVEAISDGKTTLIALLRNNNFFPVGWCIDRIADAVIAMFDTKDEQSEELVFDDKNFIAQHLVESGIQPEVMIEEVLEDSDDIDDLLDEDDGDDEVPYSDTDDNHEQYDEEKR